MKVVYIAHPISGDIKGNLEKIVQIAREINLNEPDTVPVANYFLDCYALNDDIPEERERGIKNDIALFRKKYIDEVRLYGDRISNGMKEEVKLARELGIKVVAMTEGTKSQLEEILREIPKYFSSEHDIREFYKDDVEDVVQNSFSKFMQRNQDNWNNRLGINPPRAFKCTCSSCGGLFWSPIPQEYCKACDPNETKT